MPERSSLKVSHRPVICISPSPWTGDWCHNTNQSKKTRRPPVHDRSPPEFELVLSMKSPPDGQSSKLCCVWRKDTYVSSTSTWYQTVRSIHHKTQINRPC
jgi:hypothetical protein